MQITDVEKKIDDAIQYIEIAIDRIETQSTNFDVFPRDVKLGDIAADYEKNAYDLNQLIQNLRNIKRMNRFLKIDDATKMKILSQYQNNEETKPIIITEIYTVSELDTLEGIAIKMKVDWKKIAEYNEIDSMYLTAGDELSIPREIDPRLIFQYQNEDTAVFDLPSGENVLGKDLPDTLAIDNDGDLDVMKSRETFVQGMQNICDTDLGALPFYPSYGMDHYIGDDIPRDIRESWKKEKIRQSFIRDARVFEVPLDEIEITRGVESETITVNVYPIQGLDFETITAQFKFQSTVAASAIPAAGWDYIDDIDEISPDGVTFP